MQKSDCIIGVEHVSKFFGDKADIRVTVADAEKADAGGLIRTRHVGKRRCRFRNRCVCMCVFKYSVIVRGNRRQIHGRYRRNKS